MIEALTALLVIITAFYAWVTYGIFKANSRVVEEMNAQMRFMREQHEATYRPYVTVVPYLEPDNPIFYLRISNTGKSAAMDLRLKLDRSFFQYGERTEGSNLAGFSLFNDQIDSFPPGSEITFGLAQSFIIFAKDVDPTLCPTLFTITATYRFGSETVEERNIIDLRAYSAADVPQDPSIRKLKEITRSIDHLTGVIKSAITKISRSQNGPIED